MTAAMLMERDWFLRAEIYAHFVARGRAQKKWQNFLALR